MLRLAVTTCLLLSALAGCTRNDAAGTDQPTPSATPTVASAPRYDLTVFVRAETPDGAILEGADVYAVPVDQLPIASKDLPNPVITDTLGRARFTFAKPTEVALQVLGPGASGGGWTREGVVVFVDQQVGIVPDQASATTQRAVAVGNELTVPLLRSSLRFEANTTWQTTVALPQANGTRQAALLAVPLPLPDGDLREAYLQRLVAGELQVSWTNGAMGFGDLFAGWSWDASTAWLSGDDALQAPTPGSARESWNGAFPVAGRPADLRAATLHAAALTNHAVVGDVEVSFSVTLRFDGNTPPGLSPPGCLRTTACGLPDIPL